MKRLGPDLKMLDLRSLKTLKPPAALNNVYYDLRDRRLLPLVALVVVAILATPFLLGNDAKEPDASLPPTAELEDDAADAQAITVIEATPGLRDYRQRLDGRTPTDPFRQRYAGVPEEAKLESSLSESASSEGSSSSFEETVTVEDGSASVEVEPDGSGGSSGGGSNGGGESTGEDLRLIEFRFDIQVSRTEPTGDGGLRWSEPQLRRRVPSLTQLPGKRKTVATVGGINLLNDKVYFLVSDEVKSLDGEFVCKTRTQGGLCELLELEVNVPLELISGPNDVGYRIKVIGVEAIWAGQSNAPEPRGRRGFGGLPSKSLPLVPLQ
jgi:hypothetical protein